METATCGWVRRFLGPWKDGELDPADAARIEGHIADCSACAEQARFERWFSDEVRRLVDRPQAPARLADRISLDLRREQRRQRMRRAVVAFGGLAAAAGLAVVVALAFREAPSTAPVAGDRGTVARDLGAGGAPPSTPSAPPGFLLAGQQEGDIGADLVDRHERAVVRALPLELASGDADALGAWFRDKVSFSVVPPRFSGSGARLVGGRLTHVRDQDAAYLGYEVAGHPLSVLVVPEGRVPLGGQRVYSVGGTPVFVSHRGRLGYAVLVRGGIVYALVSDLPDAVLLDLASQIP